MKLTDFYTSESIPVTSVNKKTGNVVLNSADVGAIAQSEKSVTIPVLKEGIVPDSQLPKYVKLVNGKVASSQIPIATAFNIGGIKIGSGFTITEEGTLSVDFSGIEPGNSSVYTSTYTIGVYESTPSTSVRGGGINTKDIPILFNGTIFETVTPNYTNYETY